jgi:AbrB family looped-hinge helix DNA binding protein
MIATVTSKGQITIPAVARKSLGINAGSRIDFVINENDHLEMIPVSGSVKKLKGMVRKPKHSLSLKDMDAAIAAGASQ